ncbi:MAG TPA: hypothetical protein VMD07_03045 [Candidatus Acidoferrales bacterium]|nr:hypothetical protein [Candidatus Acidoferrales bacterium]
MRRLLVPLISIALIAAVASRSDAATGKITTFTKLCSGSISFSVVDITHAQLPGSESCSFSLEITTSANQGSITVTAPVVTGSTGAKISQNAFYALCSASSDPSGIFSSSGTVQLGSSAVTCATIASSSKNKTVTFSVSLFLDDTADATAFPGDPAYTATSLSVTANAP